MSPEFIHLIKYFGKLLNVVFFRKRKAVHMEKRWRKKPQAIKSSLTAAIEDVSSRLREMSVAENSGQSHASVSSVSKLLEDFIVDKSTYSRALVRATFYPKFENEKSDQEVIFLIPLILLCLCK